MAKRKDTQEAKDVLFGCTAEFVNDTASDVVATSTDSQGVVYLSSDESAVDNSDLSGTQADSISTETGINHASFSPELMPRQLEEYRMFKAINIDKAVGRTITDITCTDKELTFHLGTRRKVTVTIDDGKIIFQSL